VQRAFARLARAAAQMLAAQRAGTARGERARPVERRVGGGDAMPGFAARPR
jgi:hypothetical protein